MSFKESVKKGLALYGMGAMMSSPMATNKMAEDMIDYMYSDTDK